MDIQSTLIRNIPKDTSVTFFRVLSKPFTKRRMNSFCTFPRMYTGIQENLPRGQTRKGNIRGQVSETLQVRTDGIHYSYTPSFRSSLREARTMKNLLTPVVQKVNTEDFCLITRFFLKRDWSRRKARLLCKFNALSVRHPMSDTMSDMGAKGYLYTAKKRGLLKEGGEHFTENFWICRTFGRFHALTNEELQSGHFAAFIIQRHFLIGRNYLFYDSFELPTVTFLQKTKLRGKLFRLPYFFKEHLQYVLGSA